MHKRSPFRLVVSGLFLCLCAVGLLGTPALASATHPDPAGMTLDLGPFPGAVPANCPFTSQQDASFLFLDGAAVVYGTANKNGSWGGLNVEGTAIFKEDGVPLYQGHVHFWFGSGYNIQGQSEFGLTLNFHGTGAAGTLALHGNAHMTINANGTPTANVTNINVTCA